MGPNDQKRNRFPRKITQEKAANQTSTNSLYQAKQITGKRYSDREKNRTKLFQINGSKKNPSFWHYRQSWHAWQNFFCHVREKNSAQKQQTTRNRWDVPETHGRWPHKNSTKSRNTGFIPNFVRGCNVDYYFSFVCSFFEI